MSMYRKGFALFAVVGALFVSTGCTVTATSTTTTTFHYDEQGRLCGFEQECTDTYEVSTPQGTTVDVSYNGFGVTITNEDGSQMECTPKKPGLLDELFDQLECLCEEEEDTSSSSGTGGTASGVVSGSVSVGGELDVKGVEGGTCGETETFVETEECSADANFDKADWKCTPVATPKK